MAGDERDDDVDRAAILARRQKFIALALSGLAASCGDDKGAEPQPCLDVGPVTTGNVEPGETDGATSTTGGDGTGDTTGDTGSSSASGSGSSSGSDETAGSTSANGGETGTTGRPMPCLAPKGQ